MDFHEYFEKYGFSIIHWAHIRSRCKCTLEEVMTYISQNDDVDLQVLYANDSSLTTTKTFQALVSLVNSKPVWAINVGEAEFSTSQCDEITSMLRNSNVAFMFADAILVGNDYVRVWKDIIRERRRNTLEARWLLGNDKTQNHIIQRCRNMWWPPMALGRNKRWKNQRRDEASIISRLETGELRLTCCAATAAAV